jgi:GTP cyclohydrolase II
MEKQHVNIENDEVTIPYYAVHKDSSILGFFGPFRFLSNFFILENGVCLDEVYYPSVEHAYQAAKWPYDQREQFLGVTAGGSKKLGKQAPKLNVRKWDKTKVSIMNSLCRQKFDKNGKLRQMLLMTEGCQLEERNSWGDIFWGTDMNGHGENILGRILMNIRHDLLTNKEMF